MTKIKHSEEIFQKNLITDEQLEKIQEIFKEELEKYGLETKENWAFDWAKENYNKKVFSFLQEVNDHNIINMSDDEKVEFYIFLEQIKNSNFVSKTFNLINNQGFLFISDEKYFFEDDFFSEWYLYKYKLDIHSKIYEEMLKKMKIILLEKEPFNTLTISEKVLNNWLDNYVLTDLYDYLENECYYNEKSNWFGVAEEHDFYYEFSEEILLNIISKQELIQKSIPFFFEEKSIFFDLISSYDNTSNFLARHSIVETNIHFSNKVQKLKNDPCFSNFKKVLSFEELENKTIKEILSPHFSKELINAFYAMIFEKYNGKDPYFLNFSILEDPLNVKEEINRLLNLKYKELFDNFSSHKNLITINRIQHYLMEMKSLMDLKKKNYLIWHRDILGDSVFKKYKTNSPDKIFIHTGDTNTGKTYQALNSLKKAKTGAYLAPLRLLALEKYEELIQEGINCSYTTGEENIISENATHISCTIEKTDYTKEYDCVVIDESQMIGDDQRGSSWAKAILGVKAKELHIIVAPEGLSIIKKILQNKKLNIKHYKRDKPLIVDNKNRDFNTVKKGDALVVFSRKKVLEVASDLEKLGKRSAIIYGAMPPSVRKKQVESFKNGEYDVVVTTDAIGMGLNLPIENIFFLSNEKFDGKITRELTTTELKQIAGRAGRRGFFEQGKVSFLKNANKMNKKLNSNSKQINTIFIKPPFDMVKNFKDKLGISNSIKALELFFINWEKYIPKENFVLLEDISELKNKLSLIKKHDIKNLSLEKLWNVINLPVSLDSLDLVSIYTNNVNHLANKTKPKKISYKISNNLSVLEEKYKKILVIMYFLDENDEFYAYYQKFKEDVSKQIFKIIKEQYGVLKKRCIRCRNPLKKRSTEKICAVCIRKAEKKKRRKQKLSEKAKTTI